MTVRAKEFQRWLEMWKDDHGGVAEGVRFTIEVCDECGGRGTTYLGWSAAEQPSYGYEDFQEDPDFAEAYMNREYDRSCPGCDGRNVVEEFDDKGSSPDAVESWHEWITCAYEDAAVRRMESGIY